MTYFAMHKLLGSRAQATSHVTEKGDFAILPRRKAGQSANGGERAQPISISKAVLEKYFHMSLNQASKELVNVLALYDMSFNIAFFNIFYQGICATAIKKVCRFAISFEFSVLPRLIAILAGSLVFSNGPFETAM